MKIIDSSCMLPNIKSHSIMVCRVSLAITDTLAKSGVYLDHGKIQASALLHDITKTRSLETGENHAVTGAEFLKELGYNDVAEIVRQHIYPDNGVDAISEAEVVSYADKRVLHDRFVTLNERFDYLLQRYGIDNTAIERIMNLKKMTRNIEIKIFKAINSETIEI